MTPANQHTGIERLSDERLRESIETLRFNAQHLIAEDDKDDALHMLEVAREVMAGVADALSSLRASAEPEPVRAALAHLLAEMLDLADDEMAQPITSDILVNPYEAADHIISTLFASSSAVDGRVTEETASCPGCSGTGNQGGNQLYGDCDDCNGTGRVNVPGEVALTNEMVERAISAYCASPSYNMHDMMRAALEAALAGGSNGRE